MNKIIFCTSFCSLVIPATCFAMEYNPSNTHLSSSDSKSYLLKLSRSFSKKKLERVEIKDTDACMQCKKKIPLPKYINPNDARKVWACVACYYRAGRDEKPRQHSIQHHYYDYDE